MKKTAIIGTIIYSICILLYIAMIVVVFVPLGQHCRGLTCVVPGDYSTCTENIVTISWLYCLQNKAYNYKFMIFMLVLLGLCPGLTVFSIICKRENILFWIINLALVIVVALLFINASMLPFFYKAC